MLLPIRIISFSLLLSSLPLHVYMPHPLICLSVDGCVFLAVAARAAVNIDGHGCFHVSASGCMPGWDCRVGGWLYFQALREPPYCSPEWPQQLAPRQQCRGALPPHPLQDGVGGCCAWVMGRYGRVRGVLWWQFWLTFS